MDAGAALAARVWMTRGGCGATRRMDESSRKQAS